jgi:DNA-directed RNA polymerase subunit RPC12/RpoP
MKKVKMERVQHPDSTMSIVLPTAARAALRGQGDTDYTCANCGKILLRRVLDKEIRNLVFKCPLCGSHSRIPASHGARRK